MELRHKDYVIKTCPAQRRTIHFDYYEFSDIHEDFYAHKKDLKSQTTHFLWFPPTVFWSEKHPEEKGLKRKLSVAAIKDSDTFNLDSQIYMLPLPNIYSSCQLCMGGLLREEKPRTLDDLIASFWTSHFYAHTETYWPADRLLPQFFAGKSFDSHVKWFRTWEQCTPEQIRDQIFSENYKTLGKKLGK